MANILKNFKGIQNLELDLSKKLVIMCILLVGINESGKTTILEETLNTYSYIYQNRLDIIVNIIELQNSKLIYFSMSKIFSN